MKHISNEIQWCEAIPIVNKAINEHAFNRLAKCRNITDNKEKVRIAKRIFLLTIEFAIGILMFIRVKQIRYEEKYHDKV
jgi:hypothetical protein